MWNAELLDAGAVVDRAPLTSAGIGRNSFAAVGALSGSCSRKQIAVTAITRNSVRVERCGANASQLERAAGPPVLVLAKGHAVDVVDGDVLWLSAGKHAVRFVKVEPAAPAAAPAPPAAAPLVAPAAPPVVAGSWEVKLGGDFKAYGAEEQRLLEAAFLRGEAEATITVRGTQYVVTLTPPMKQKVRDNQSRTRDVRRVGGGAPPDAAVPAAKKQRTSEAASSSAAPPAAPARSPRRSPLRRAGLRRAAGAGAGAEAAVGAEEG